jgi:Bromodomain
MNKREALKESVTRFSGNCLKRYTDICLQQFPMINHFTLIMLQCKNVISKLWKRIDRDGHQLIPLLSDWWRRNEKATFMTSGSSLLNLRRIEHRVDGSEYNDVMDFIADLQLMLKDVVRYFNNSYTLYQVCNSLSVSYAAHSCISCE